MRSKAAIITILVLALFQTTAISLHAATVKNYVIWWPKRTTPWAFELSKDFNYHPILKYQKATQYPALYREYRKLLNTHRPDLIVVMIDDPLYLMIPRRHLDGTGKLPEGNAKISDIVYDQLTFDYFDDLFDLIETSGIDYIIYLNSSAYGGFTPYPYTYLNKLGWFWKRPDWNGTNQGLASPHYHAMRHPPACGSGLTTNCIPSDYNWLAHGGSYEVFEDQPTYHHWERTNNGTEDTGIGTWQVAESADMVFNLFDTNFGYWVPGIMKNVHTPIPSFSSQIYRDFTHNYYKKIAQHFKDRKQLAYFLFQEPSYAHLRENIGFVSGHTGAGVEDSRWYEADYSPAEKDRYNEWRSQRGQSPVSRVPYPINDNYRQFREDNLADFQKNLATAIRQADTNAKIHLSIFRDDIRLSTPYNPRKFIQTINPSFLSLEPPHVSQEVFDNSTKRNQFLQDITASGKVSHFVSYYKELPVSKDQTLANQFATVGINNYYAPAVTDPKDPEGYATWAPDGCSGCTFRYKRSAQAPSIPADFNQDGTTNIFDLNILIKHYRTHSEDKKLTYEQGDINGDDAVNLTDYKETITFL